jgi:hypothetical protein
MMRLLIALGLVGVVVLAGSRLDARGSGAPQSVSTCYPTDDYAIETLTFLRRLAIATTGDENTYRAAVMLPQLNDTTTLIYQVSDSATCAAALGPHNTHAEYTSEELALPQSQRLYLFRYQQLWVSSNPTLHESSSIGWTGLYVMDSTFQLVKAFIH